MDLPAVPRVLEAAGTGRDVGTGGDANGQDWAEDGIQGSLLNP